MNVDAVVATAAGLLGYGCIIRNNLGDIIGAVADRKCRRVPARAVKLWAIWYRLKFCLDNGFRDVVLEPDCLQAI